jgi:cardiolipin synthase
MLPNLFTTLRVVLVPVLWVLALLGHARLVGVGLGVAGLTDAVDGFLARRLHAASAQGSRYDSVADHLLFASAVGWVVLLRPDFIRERWLLLSIWIGIGLISFTVGWLRFRRFADLHLYSAKTAVVLGIVFAVQLLSFGEYAEWFFNLTIGMAILAAAETLLVQLTRDRVDEHVGSLLRRRRGGRAD